MLHIIVGLHKIVLRQMHVSYPVKGERWNIHQILRLPCVSVTEVRFRTGQYINRLQPTGHVMHQQFNIQQLYALPTLYLCVLYLSENKQQLVPLTA